MSLALRTSTKLALRRHRNQQHPCVSALRCHHHHQQLIPNAGVVCATAAPRSLGLTSTISFSKRSRRRRLNGSSVASTTITVPNHRSFFHSTTPLLSSSSSSSAIQLEEDPRDDTTTRPYPSKPAASSAATDSTSTTFTSRRVERNKLIVALGRQKEWKEILNLYKKESTEYSSVNYATTLSQLKRLPVDKQHPVFVEFMDDLANHIVDRGLLWIDCRGLSTVAHSLGKLSMNISCKSVQTIMDFLSKDAIVNVFFRKGNTMEIANVCWGMARVGDSKNLSKFLQPMESNPQWYIDKSTTHALTTTFWACGKLQVPSPKLFAAMDMAAGRILQEIKDKTNSSSNNSSHHLCNKGADSLYGFANIVWACARLQVAAPNLIAQLDQEAHWLIERCESTQDVTRMAWACGKLRPRKTPCELFGEMDRHAKRLVERAKPQEVANQVWAFARLGIPAPNLLLEMDRQADRIFNEQYYSHHHAHPATPQAISNMAWACATLEQQQQRTAIGGTPSMQVPLNIFTQLERRSKWLVEKGSPQAVANSVWACATLQQPSPRLFQHMEKNIHRMMKTAQRQNVANMAWACATANVDAPQLFAEIETHAEWLIHHHPGGKMPRSCVQEVSNIAWACATLHMYTPNFFSEMERQSAWLVEKGASQSVVNTAWACATLGFESPQLFRCIMENVDGFLKGGNQLEIATLCFSLGILDLAQKYPDEFQRLWSKALRFWNPERLGVGATTMLVQAYALAEASGLHGLQEPPPNSFEIGIAHSRAQDDVSLLLRQVGFEHEVEVSPFKAEHASFMPRGLLSIDMACKDRMIAIDFDGPSHFLREVGTGNVTSIEDGSRKAKRRFLHRLGWTTIDIRAFDWGKFNGRTEDEKKEYLHSLVKDVL